MGGLRLLLALAVMVEHMGYATPPVPIFWFGARIAVIIFLYCHLVVHCLYNKLYKPCVVRKNE